MVEMEEVVVLVVGGSGSGNGSYTSSRGTSRGALFLRHSTAHTGNKVNHERKPTVLCERLGSLGCDPEKDCADVVMVVLRGNR